MEIKEILSNNVKSIRIARGNTLVEFATELQISKSTLQKIEMTGNTTMATLAWISKTVGISPAELIADQTVPKTLTIVQWLLEGTQLLSHLPPDQRIRIIECLTQLMEELGDG